MQIAFILYLQYSCVSTKLSAVPVMLNKTFIVTNQNLIDIKYATTSTQHEHKKVATFRTLFSTIHLLQCQHL